MAYYNNNKYGITVDALKTKVKCEPCGAYLFFGEEEYLKSFYLDKFRELVDKGGFGQLDHAKFDFENKTVEDLASEFFVMPMGGELRLLEVWNMPLQKLSAKDFEDLMALIDEIPSYLIFVIYCRNGEYSVDKSVLKKASDKERSEIIEAKFNAVNFTHLGENTLINWIEKKCLQPFGLRTTERAARLLIKYCSSDMLRMRNELYKLEQYLKSEGREELSVEDVKLFVIPDSDVVVFDLADAVLMKDAGTAREIMEGLKLTRTEPISIAGVLFRALGGAALAVSGVDDKSCFAAAKLSSWQVKRYRDLAGKYDRSYFADALALCLECDGKLKGYGSDGYMLVENLVYQLIMLGVEKSSFYK